ncbi:MAG: hypothetical protein PHP00_00695 [Thiotrichaceae bacterium]|nr:hypothetical protein [Thiotrichaceae bacterium]
MDSFKAQHRTHTTDFTRDRKLSFPLLMTLLLQKGVKSIQLLLNEMSLHWGVSPVSHSAFSQRRMQLKHTAFIELNQKAVVDVMLPHPASLENLEKYLTVIRQKSKVNMPMAWRV